MFWICDSECLDKGYIQTVASTVIFFQQLSIFKRQLSDDQKLSTTDRRKTLMECKNHLTFPIWEFDVLWESFKSFFHVVLYLFIFNVLISSQDLHFKP